ncbi:MAG: PIN domain-containing protein [Flavobacteriales bacterium]|nr:PIN domain-containing protein [Flavobacteriales bacterium]
MAGTKIFLDSNIAVYLLEAQPERRNMVASFIADDRYVISTQVVSENVNVCIRKLKLSKEQAFEHGNFLMDAFNLMEISATTIKLAFRISERYGFGYYDSLILASAIESGCDTIYTEDMQHGQSILDKLFVVNPFKEAGI